MAKQRRFIANKRMRPQLERTTYSSISRWNADMVSRIRNMTVRRHVRALLYPVAGGPSRIVQLRADGTSGVPSSSSVWPDDIDARHWFPSGTLRDRTGTLPGDLTFTLPNNYSIITDKDAINAATNFTILEEWGALVKGNVLVIKHAARAAECLRVVNVHYTEKRMIDLVVREYFDCILSTETSSSDEG